MYQCVEHPFAGKPRKVFEAARNFFKVRYGDTRSSPASIRVSGLNQPGLINRLKRHLDAKPIAEKVVRCRLLPCVRELLEKTTDLHIHETDSSGKVAQVFYGEPPNGWRFKVVINADQNGNLRLISCYRTRM